jgi:RNA polymerase sigma factor (sigma-70 family)
MKDDAMLLQEFVGDRSEAAFAELVSRHINLVYSAALRMVHEPAVAEDVVQSVFVELARKAPSIRDGNALPGWLYRVAQNQAANHLRAEVTRRRYEAEAMTQAQLEKAWDRISVGLEEAMASLSPAEQNLLVMRFFQDLSWRDVGAAVELSEDTVQRRVGRALEKLRSFFAREGVVLPAAVIGLTITANAVHAAPASLVTSVTSASLAGAAGMAAYGGLTFTKTLLMKKIAYTLIAVTIAVGAAVPIVVARTEKKEAEALEASLRDGKILHYTFDKDEGGGQVTDVSGTGNHGQATGANWTASGHRGGAYQFAPPNQYIRVPNNASLNPTNITLAAWFMTTINDDTWRRLFDKSYRGGYALSIGGGWTPGSTWQGKAVIEIAMDHNKNKGITSSDGIVTDGHWHHVAVTYNGQEQVLYLDGVKQKRVAQWGGNIPSNDRDLTLGMNLFDPDPRYNEVGSSFNGMIDDPMIWNRALSEKEIVHLFESQQ